MCATIRKTGGQTTRRSRHLKGAVVVHNASRLGVYMRKTCSRAAYFQIIIIIIIIQLDLEEPAGPKACRILQRTTISPLFAVSSHKQ